ncbi:LOW QUALITY PROTEIN: latent-transforming growth factor beta-binding protein 1-like [Pristis pectinata]|uniref:LOW QUALITY PROTEIN: latent-transforming growth factor beta-binding protein 1-like n=1 Tax=Pristis pectinata TaxID=685728 RepID=UPI00223DE1E5|nr:LOW QUALITY PROTEIN: latent-transforming growth factor beta-binding protein 1-like [Pristis pectinata]
MRWIGRSGAVALGCCLILALLPRQAKPGVSGTPRSAAGRAGVRAARMNVCGVACCRGWAFGPQTGRCTKQIACKSNQPDAKERGSEISQMEFRRSCGKCRRAALCFPRCRNGGFCQRPQTCACKPGFEGRRCETKITLQNQLNSTVPSTQPRSLEGLSAGSSMKGERGPGERKAASSHYIVRKKASVRRQPLLVKQAQTMLLRKLSPSSKLPVAAKSQSPHITKSQGNKTSMRMAGRSQPTVKQSKLKVLCTLRCQNGGMCVRRDRCRCTPGFTGRLCQIPTSSTNSQVLVSFPTEEPGSISKPRIQSVYTLPLSNQRLQDQTDQRMPSIVNLRVNHPPEVSVKVHRVSQVDGGRNSNSAQQGIVQGTIQRALQDQAMQDQLGSLTVIPQSSGDYPFGYCFTEITNGQCAAPLTGLRTMEHCCRGGGVGWGVTECRECPMSPENECPQGFQKMVDGECQDINECTSPRICQNGKCVNVRGSYGCLCNPGYVQDTSKSRCISQQVISLTRGPCYRIWRSGSCSLPVVQNITKQICCCSRVGKAWGPNCQRCPSPGTGAFREVCPAGPGYHYTRSDLRYINRVIEERSQSREPVDQVRQTTTLAPRIQHTVAPRLRLTTSVARIHTTTTTAQPRSTTPAPELHICLRVPQVCGPGRCVMRQQDYTCVCNTGFQLNAERSRCVDTDECGQRPSPCPNARCENMVGSYRCVCSRGFAANSHGTDCIDIDECLDDFTCPNSECVNSIGSFHCLPCPTGYQIRNRKCADIDECANGATCGEAGMCVNTEGSYQCTCNPGYRLSADGNQCADINECFEGDFCAPYGECLNSAGSYTCLCAEGFTTSSDLSTCLDVDECTTAGRCDRGHCSNTVGSFECSCEPGFRVDADRSQCLDLDECVEYPTICGSKRCENSPGSFQCITECGVGFLLSPAQDCIDIDECSNATICGPNAYCQNVAASFQCHCDRGYQMASDGSRCVDLDECVEYPTICGSKRCENSPGSFQCITECGVGFLLSPAQDCIDIDECSNTTICGPNAYCQNVAASFQCHCDRGYQMASDGSRCVDVNECETMQGVCDSAACENVPGSFLCICLDEKEEFDPITGRCNSPAVHAAPAREENECYYNLNDVQLCQNILAHNVTRQECCCTVGEGWGKDCRIYQCPEYDSDEYRSLCPWGRGFLSLPRPTFGRSYMDADECSLFGSKVCKNGVCLNTVPGYSCYCPIGYYYHSTLLECIDNDECEDETACDNGDCVNTVGSYYCSCRPPLILDVSLRRCTSNSSEQFDVHMALCWQEVGRNLLCKRPFLERLTTYTECCCQYGEALGMDCALCPTRNTEYHNALCNYLSAPIDEDDGYPYGLEYENYGLPFGAELTPDSLRTYDTREYDAAPPPLSDGRGSRPSELELFPARDPLGSRTLYESRRQRSGPVNNEQSSPSRSRYQPRARHTGRGYSTRSTQVSLHELQNRQPDPAPDFHPPVRPRLVSSNEEYDTQYQQYNSLQCGILNGCENGKCIRVPEGFTCDCDAGYRLDMTKMTCVDVNECDEVEDPTVLCRNAKCVNTDGSYRCICLRGYVLSRQPNYCTTARGSVRGTGL